MRGELFPDALRILLKEDGSEYYLLENRQRAGTERGLPGTGLLVWYVKDRQGKQINLNAEVQDLVEGNAIGTPDAAWKFLRLVPLPGLRSNIVCVVDAPEAERLAALDDGAFALAMEKRAPGAQFHTRLYCFAHWNGGLAAPCTGPVWHVVIRIYQ